MHNDTKYRPNLQI